LWSKVAVWSTRAFFMLLAVVQVPVAGLYVARESTSHRSRGFDRHVPYVNQ
jgi:hypothetical protein